MKKFFLFSIIFLFIVSFSVPVFAAGPAVQTVKFSLILENVSVVYVFPHDDDTKLTKMSYGATMLGKPMPDICKYQDWYGCIYTYGTRVSFLYPTFTLQVQKGKVGFFNVQTDSSTTGGGYYKIDNGRITKTGSFPIW